MPAPYTEPPHELTSSELSELPTHTAVASCGVEPIIHASLVPHSPYCVVPVLDALGRLPPPNTLPLDQAAMGSMAAVTPFAVFLSTRRSPSLGLYSYSTSPEPVVTLRTKCGWCHTPLLVSVDRPTAISIGRDGYWPKMMPSYGSPLASDSVCDPSGLFLRTPSAHAMCCVSTGPFFRSFCRRMKLVLRLILVACWMVHVPHVIPSEFVTVASPVCTGSDEYIRLSGMPCWSAAARPKILNVEPVCTGAFA